MLHPISPNPLPAGFTYTHIYCVLGRHVRQRRCCSPPMRSHMEPPNPLPALPTTDTNSFSLTDFLAHLDKLSQLCQSPSRTTNFWKIYTQNSSLNESHFYTVPKKNLKRKPKLVFSLFLIVASHLSMSNTSYCCWGSVCVANKTVDARWTRPQTSKQPRRGDWVICGRLSGLLKWLLV